MKRIYVTMLALLALLSYGQDPKSPTGQPKKGHTGLLCVNVNGKYGYIDKTGKYVINPQFDKAGSFSEELAVVEIGGKWVYIDKTGKFIWELSG